MLFCSSLLTVVSLGFTDGSTYLKKKKDAYGNYKLSHLCFLVSTDFQFFRKMNIKLHFFLLCYKTYSKLGKQISFPDSWFQNNWTTTEFSSVEMIQLGVNKYSLTLQGHLVFPFFCLLPSFFCSLQTVKTSVVVFLAENNIFFNQNFFTLNQRQTRRVKKIIWLFIQYLYC